LAGNYSKVTTVVTGATILAADRNAEHDNHITNMTPAGGDDYSTNAAQMQSTADPYPAASESLATSLAGELERLRFVIKQITGEAQWYIDPDTTIASLFAQTAGDGLTGGAGAAFDVNVDDSTIEIATDALQVKDAGITAAKLAAAVAGDGLTGGAGSALAVNVDDSTIEINSDAIRVKDSGVTQAKLSTKVSSSLHLMSGGSTIGTPDTRFVGNNQVNATEATVQIRIPFSGTLKNFYLHAAGTTGGSRTYTIRVNGSDTALTVTANNTADTSATADVAVSAGDLLALKVAVGSGSGEGAATAACIVLAELS
jgi:hypothetical protein